MQSLDSILELLNNSDTGDVPGVLKHIMEVARELLGATIYFGSTWNPFGASNVYPDILIDQHERAAVSTETVQHVLEMLATQVQNQSELLLLNEVLASDPLADLLLQSDSYIYGVLSLHIPHRRCLPTILLLGFSTPPIISFHEQGIVRSFVRQAAEKLYNAWSIYRYQEVLRIGSEINQEHSNAATLFRRLAVDASTILDTSHSLLLAVFQPQNSELDLYFTEKGLIRQRRGEPLNGACRWVIEHQQPSVIKELSTERAQLPFVPIDLSRGQTNEESLIFIPLVLRGISYGVLSIQHPNAHHYDAEDLLILQLLGNHIALSLNNIYLYGNLRRLNQMGQALTSELTSAQVLQVVVEAIRDTTRADLVTLFPYEQELQRFVLPPTLVGTLREPEYPQPSVTQPDDVTMLLIRQTKPFFVADSTALYETVGGKQQRRGSFEQREGIASTAALPLFVASEVVGVLFVNFRHPQSFDEGQKLLIEGLGRYAAIAIKNARTFSDVVQRRTAELTLLNRIDQAVGRTLLKLEDVLEALLPLVNERIPAETALILLYNHQQQELELRASADNATDVSKLTQILNPAAVYNISLMAFRENRSVRVTDAQLDLARQDAYAPESSTRSVLAVPLFDDEVLGVLTFTSVQANAFSEQDENFLLALANRVVLAIRNAQAYEREQRLAKESQALVDIGKEIVGQLDPQRAFERILDRALALTNSTVGNLMLYDSRRDDLWMAAGRGQNVDPSTWRQRLGDGVVGIVASTKQLLNVDIEEPRWKSTYRAAIPGMRYELAVPLLALDDMYGVINIERAATQLRFDEREERLLGAFADLAVIALQNADRYRNAAAGRARLEALHSIDLEIIRQVDDTDQVMRVILAQALALTNAERADLDLYVGIQASTTYFQRRDTAVIDPYIERIDASDSRASQIQRGIITYVQQTLQPYYTADDAQEDVYYRGDTDIHSEMAVPLLSEEGVLVGVLNIESRIPYAFGPEQLYVLQLFANQAVIAIQNARSYAQAARNLRRFEALYGAGRELATISDILQVNAAYDIVIRWAYQHSNSQVVIRRIGPNGTLYVVQAVTDHPIVPVQRMERDKGLNGVVLRTGEAQVIHDVDNWTGITVVRSLLPERSLVVIPITFETNVYGTLTLMHQDANHFLDADVELFMGLAQQLAIAIHRLETTEARLKAEQNIRESETMTAIGQNVANLTHDLGNDLGLVPSIINGIRRELAAKDQLSPSVADKLDAIRQDVKRVLKRSKTLKGELRDMTHGRAPTLHRVSELVQQALRLVRVTRYIKVMNQTAASDFIVRCDAEEVHTIMNCLITNAIEAMGTRGTITLRAEEQENMIAIQVIDTGPGIADTEQIRIFNLGYSTKQSSGYGLWSARRNALLNGGDLQVASELGESTTFTLVLPVA